MIGEQAPDFSALDGAGNTHTLADYKGKKLLLYFYPKDDTETCTKQAYSLRDGYAALKKKGIAILGVSPDPVKSHAKFTKKYDLPFPLLSDPDHAIAEAYGIWGLKKFMGREFMGILRTSFLIGKDGTIDNVIRDVKSKEHAAQVLELWK